MRFALTLPSPPARLCGVVIAACLCAAQPAWASLGQRMESVRADRAKLAASLSSTQGQAFVVHTLTLPAGGRVREFAAPDGVGCAVSWRGHGRPDLRQLLGEHFETMQADTAVRAGRRLRVPLTVDRSDFVVRSGGHPGAFWGTAFLPQQAPAGVTLRDLQTP